MLNTPVASRGAESNFEPIATGPYSSANSRIKQPEVWNFREAMVTHPGIPI